MTATIHLMHGFIGFGKTTIAKQLAHSLPAVILSGDENNDLIWVKVKQLIKNGNNVIIDGTGLWSVAQRRAAYACAKEITDNVVFHIILCDMETARNSVLERTKRDDSGLAIDENTFDCKRSEFEPIDADEKYPVIFHDNNLMEMNFASYVLPARIIDGKKQVALSVYDNRWYAPIGGRRDNDETPRETIIRELREELGDTATPVIENLRDVPNPIIVPVRDIWKRRAKTEQHTYFIAPVPADTELKFGKNEDSGYEIQWIDAAKLSDPDLIKLDDMRKYMTDVIIPLISNL
ncbi:MAG: AAA family ATPase [Rickettsiales bacterium]|jgi:predicted kinase/8-oxo-dGTP pyrophosphatase MutT (NUDIX family)|nr:AAA family ATPase [Rickettsiales bacterium]